MAGGFGNPDGGHLLGATFVRISGPSDGPPLVLLPGANATSLMWETNIEAFSRDHRGRRGRQRLRLRSQCLCSKPQNPSRFRVLVRRATSTLSASRNTNLTGPSYGGWIASEYTLEHPERIEKLVLIAPAATVLQFSMDFIKKGILCMIPHKHFVTSMMHWALADAAAGTEEQRRMAEEAADNAWLGIRCFKPKQMVAPRILSDEELRGLAPPTLFLVGENEVIYSGSAADAVQRLNSVAPQIITEVLPDCGHDLTLVQAELVNRLVLEFLELPPAETSD